jgi:glycosyltransferase involved in cell wall biosynthesis
VVVVDEELPYPPVTGKRLRTFKLLIRLARRHCLTYICHRNADPEEGRVAAKLFADHNIESILVDRTVPPKAGPGFYARLAANLFSSLPYSVATHSSLQLRQAVENYSANHAVDLWQCEWTPYTEALDSLRGVRRLVVAHNVESLIWKRYHEHEPNLVRRWYIKKQWQKFEEFEQRAFLQADGIVAVSPEDAHLIKQRFGGRRVEVVENGVDTDYFRPLGGSRDPEKIVFLGSLEWRPNLDAVRLLIDTVFPAVQREIPSAKLDIVGRNPPVWLQQYAQAVGGVKVHANVNDVRPYLARSGIMAVPLRIGGGSRLKILEALACRLPVVSTRVGAEGLALERGRHFTIVERVEDMANSLVRTIRDPGPSLAMAESGRRRVLESYHWDALADKLERIWWNTAQLPACKDGQRA